MSSILPITVEDFKAYFCKDNGFEFQPYPTWVRTAFDAGEYCLYDGVFYQSTMGRNVTSPANIDPDDPEWYVASTVYVEGSEYTVGDVVGYEGKFYTPKETTTEVPTNKEFWDELSEEELLERFPEYRVWKQPTVYSEGDKVIGMVNYKLGVYQSTIDDNAYGLTDIYSDTPIEQRAWELLEDEEVDWILDSDIERAMGEAMFKFNASLVPNEEKRKIIALYLTAFFIAYDRQMSNAVGYEGKFYTPKETTTEVPTNKEFWDELSEEELLERFPEYRVWKQPTVYSEGDKVIGMVNYKLGVYQSTIDDNAYGLTDIYSDTPIEQRAWELLEDEEVDWILDSDIERAMGEAMFKFNASLVPNEEKRKIIALYLTAFFIAYDRQMSNAGLNSNSSSGPVRSRTVGKMSVSYMESTLYSRHPAYEFFSRNMYGIKAFNLLLPYLRGNVLVLRGRVSAE